MQGLFCQRLQKLRVVGVSQRCSDRPSALRGVLQERLLGRDVQPRVGMTVKLTQQAIERRQETGRMDPSKGGVGKICKVHPNWTADVIWENTNRVRCGYACGTAAGKVSPTPPHPFSAGDGDQMVLRPFNATLLLNITTHTRRFALSISRW